jgi:hypothetical protein
VAGSCEHGNEPSGFIRRENLLTSLATISFSRAMSGKFGGSVHIVILCSKLCTQKAYH